jgi:APA family basic amino acid/polyamine antiporter
MSDSNSAPHLKQTLGFWQVALYGMGSMLGAGIYGLIGKAAGSLGNAVWLAFVVAMIAAMLTGLSYACVGSRYPRAGGASYVTQRAFGIDWMSYVVGIAVMMSGLTSMATGSQLIADNLIKALGLGIPSKLLAIALVAMIGMIIFRGIRESMWANITCTIIEASGLIFILAVGVRFWGSVDYLEVPATSLAESGLALVILQGAVLTFYSFIGFEDLLNVSEEVKDAPRNLPRGLIAAMIGSTVIYMAIAITAVSVIPYSQLATSSTPLMDVAHKAAPWFGGIDKVYVVITVFSVGNTALLNYLMGSRLLYGMSTQKLLPRALSKIHPVRHTPYVAVVALFFIVTALILSGGIKPLAEATVLLLLLVFTSVNAALLVMKWRKVPDRGQFEVPMIVPALGAVVCLTLAIARVYGGVTGSDPAGKTAPLIAGVIVVVALALYRVLKPKQVVLESEA